MNTTWSKAHRLLLIAFLIALTHFIITSVAERYIAVQIGIPAGRAVAEGLIRGYERSPQNLQKSEEEANRIFQGMKNETEGMIEKWKLPLLLMSLPIKTLVKPFLKNLSDDLFKEVLAKEISKDQFYKWGSLTAYIANFINSFCIGILVYVVLRLWRHHKMKT